MNYVNCNLCPRECYVNRKAGELGYCRCPATPMVAKTMIHKWEEPALAGEGGSGAIFFGGCTLGCKYCQNYAISGGPVGTPVDDATLRQMMEDLITQGAENIDLVTPTQYLPFSPPWSLNSRYLWCTTAAATKRQRPSKPWRARWMCIFRT